MRSPTEILSAILEKPTDISHISSLVTADVTYVSLNYSNPDLRKIMPWAGTSNGPETIVRTFTEVSRYWEVLSFEPEALFGSENYAAMFGRFTYKSAVLDKTVTSPFAAFAKCQDGRCIYLQFMEDTFATAASFRNGGSWTFQSNPNGEQVVI
jgi:uncharacterized protein